MSFAKPLFVAAFVVCFTLAAQAEPFETAFPGMLDQIDEPYRAGFSAMDIKQGKIALGAGVTLDIPAEFYFLDAKDGRFILETWWENPPSTNTLGMIFPRDRSPLEDGWGIEIFFDPMGYVSDEDATDINYDELLAEMQKDTAAANEDRVKAGFAKVDLLGWAAPPHYDAAERKLYWAKSLHFDGDSFDTLNYNIRALGRKGVLVVNFIASDDHLPQVERAVPHVLKMISFDEGHRYADFIPGTDTVAAVGIGGLIAGKVMAKTGLLVLLLAFLKKGAFLLFVPLFWLKRKIFGSKPD